MPREDELMKHPSRRRFIEMSGAAAAAFGVPMPQPVAPGLEPGASTIVHLSGDGLNLDPSEAAAELVRLCAVEKPVADQYGLTGCVEDVEKYFAALLGKERALFMPTGTLANHLAIRALARDRRRVIVQETSHIYNDTGDASQILSGLTLMPLAPRQGDVHLGRSRACDGADDLRTRTGSDRRDPHRVAGAASVG